MPASVQKKYKQLSMKIIKAEFLPQMDWVAFGSDHFGDAYVFYSSKGAKLRTTTLDMLQDGNKTTCKPVEWNEEMLIPLELPISNDTLTFSLFDSDFPKPDELISTVNFSIKYIIK